MLTHDEEDYISKIDPQKIVNIIPYDQRIKNLGNSIVNNIQSKFPSAHILFMGAVALEISGQKDIDIYILDKKENFHAYITGLSELFGEPINQTGDLSKE